MFGPIVNKEAVEKTTERVYAKKVECILNEGGKYIMETIPPTMIKDEYRYCRTDRIFWGEAQTIEAITPNILQKINAVEDLLIFGHERRNAYFTFTKALFEAFTNNGVSLRNLRSLKVYSCILNLNIEEINHILRESTLRVFEYTQRRIPNENYFGTPVNFLSDELLVNIDERVEILADCESICMSVTDRTLEAWKITLPSMVCLQNCHTSFTIGAIWELVQVAKERNKSVQWDFGCISANENDNERTVIEIQKYNGYAWKMIGNDKFRVQHQAVNLKKIDVTFIMI